MAIPSTALRLAHAAQFRLDRRFASGGTGRRARRYVADRALWLARVEAAITRGVDWFAPQTDLTMSALLVLDQARRQTGDARLDFVDDRVRRYAGTYHDPGLRAVMRDYEPDAHRHLPDIVATRPYQIIELMMIDAADLDRRGDPEHVLRYLHALADGGGYGSTHMIVGGLLMRRAGLADDPVIGPMIDRMIESQIAAVAKGNHATSYAGDLFAERIFVLEWVGRHDLVSPGWILRLLEAQMADGGWKGRNVPPVGRSNQHTTSLAVAALAQFSAAEISERDEASPQRAGELGPGQASAPPGTVASHREVTGITPPDDPEARRPEAR